MQKMKLFPVRQDLFVSVNEFLAANPYAVESFDILRSEDAESRPVHVAVLRYDDGKGVK